MEIAIRPVVRNVPERGREMPEFFVALGQCAEAGRKMRRDILFSAPLAKIVNHAILTSVTPPVTDGTVDHHMGAGGRELNGVQVPAVWAYQLLWGWYVYFLFRFFKKAG